MTVYHWIYFLVIPVFLVIVLAYAKADSDFILDLVDYIGVFLISFFWPIVVPAILMGLLVGRASNVLAKWMEGLMK